MFPAFSQSGSAPATGAVQWSHPSDDTQVDWAELVRAEYAEMPGLSLTVGQVERLWRLDSALATSLLRDLVASGFLRCTSRGMFVRADMNDR